VARPLRASFQPALPGTYDVQLDLLAVPLQLADDTEMFDECRAKRCRLELVLGPTKLIHGEPAPRGMAS